MRPSLPLKPNLRPLFGAVLLPIQRFLRLETASAFVLLGCALVALILANSGAEPSFRALLELRIGVEVSASTAHFTVSELINDGLMTLFFLVVGLEIKRELSTGELASFPKAILPAIAALGGMITPALIHFAFNRGGPSEAGWGVPVATDIAFSIGALTLLKRRVPHALIVFLTALAIFDDIGGIIVIAVFYGHGTDLTALLAALVLTALLAGAGRLRVTNGLIYAGLGAGLWYALLKAGIHPTIAGVITGLAVPARASRPPKDVLGDLRDYLRELLSADRARDIGNAEILAIEERLEDLEPPLDRFVHVLHPFVAFGVMPLFALANAGVRVVDIGFSQAIGAGSAGVFFGLVVGKTAGVFGATLLAVKLRIGPMPGAASTTKLLGVAAVAGIGFTVALFIAHLAFAADVALLSQAKIGVLLGSLASGILGCTILRLTPPMQKDATARQRE